MDLEELNKLGEPEEAEDLPTRYPNLRDIMKKNIEREVITPIIARHFREPTDTLHVVTLEDEETGIVERQIMDADGRLFPVDSSHFCGSGRSWEDNWPIDMPRS